MKEPITTVMLAFHGKILIFCWIMDIKVNINIFRLHFSYLGIKTGYTTTAGGCLSSLTAV